MALGRTKVTVIGGGNVGATVAFHVAQQGWADVVLLDLPDIDSHWQSHPLVTRAMRSLPDRFHHLLVLRELEGLSYRELADVTGIPIGTVMSRLSRAREVLRGAVRTEWEPTRSSAGPHTREQEADAVLV